MSKKKRLKPPVRELSTSTQAQPFPYRHFLALGLMAILGLLAFGNSFQVPFQFDDYPNIVENSTIFLKDFSLSWLHELIQLKFTESIRVFSFFTFALNYSLTGLRVFGFHLVNLLIHISSGLLLYGFLMLTFNLPSLRERYGSRAFPIALFSSLLFLCHPVQTQSVTYIVQRMTSLGGMFYLLALLLYVKGRLASGTRSYLYLAGMVLSYLLGLFTKENVAILPLFVALYEFYFFQNLEVGRKGKKALLYAAGFALGIGLLMVVVWGQRYVDVVIAGYKIRDFTLSERVLTQFRVLLYYLSLMAWPLPSRLNLDYDFSTSHGIFDPPSTLFAILVVAGLIGYAVWRAKRQPLVSYFILWYFGNLLIESSIFPLEMVYEHRLYLPMIGPVVLFVVFVMEVWERLRTRLAKSSEFGVRSWEKRAANKPIAQENLPRTRTTDTDTLFGPDYPLWVFFLALSLALSIAAHQRNTVWKSGITLWEDCVKKSPGKYRPYYNLGMDYYTSGRYQDAIDVLKVANRLKPVDVQVLNNLGAAYRKMGRNPEAIGAYKEALRLNPGEPEAYNNLGLAYYHSGHYPEALDALKEAVRLKPGAEEFHYNLGVTYTALGNPLSAIEAYQNAIRIRDNYAQARVNLAVSYLMVKKPALALEQYRVLKDLDRERADKLLGLINSNR